MEHCLKVLVTAFPTLRLVIKRVKLIHVFFAAGSVAHLKPRGSKMTDPNEHLEAYALPEQSRAGAKPGNVVAT